MIRLALLPALGLVPFVFGPADSQLDSPLDSPGRDTDHLHGLSGTWALIDSKGEVTDLRAEYRTVAGGSAVMETMFVGTAEETVTLYHLEGDAWSATQVNGRGAPVRFVRGESEDEDALFFEAPEPVRGQVNGLGVTVLGKDELRVTWNTVQRRRHFELRRRSDLADLAQEVANMRSSLDGLQRTLDEELKREVRLRDGKGKRGKVLLETRSMPGGPGWSVAGVPLRTFLFDQTMTIATTFASEGDEGMTLAHFPFEAGENCKVSFTVMGGHAYICAVEETQAPPRKVQDVAEFSTDLLAGKYGVMVDRLVGQRYKEPRAVEWDLSRFAGKSMRLYIVDAETNHYGQIAVGEVRITQDAEK